MLAIRGTPHDDHLATKTETGQLAVYVNVEEADQIPSRAKALLNLDALNVQHLEFTGDAGSGSHQQPDEFARNH